MLRMGRAKKEPSVDPKGFRIRGIQVSRVEGISDAVFGLAITLIVVSLQVPNTFAELVGTLKGFVGAAGCTLLLLQIWNRHYIFFRRYGLEDATTRTLNGILLFVVIAYVYPLKFLFSAFFDALPWLHVLNIKLSAKELPTLFVIYGIGFASVYSLFGLMHLQALRLGKELELTLKETLETKSSVTEHFLMAGVGLVSIVVALQVKPQNSGLAGLAYFLIPVVLTVHWSRHADAVRAIDKSVEAQGVPEPDSSVESLD